MKSFQGGSLNIFYRQFRNIIKLTYSFNKFVKICHNMSPPTHFKLLWLRCPVEWNNVDPLQSDPI